MNFKNLNICVVGCTGRIGRDIVELLYERKFPIASIAVLASEKSVGSIVMFGEQKLQIGSIENFDFSSIDIVFFALDEHLAKKYIPKAVSSGCVVIDNSSAYRMDENVLLIIPEVNGDLLQNLKPGVIVANPNCSSINLTMLLASFAETEYIPKRVVVSTYQSVSGAGTEAMNELLANTKAKFGPGFKSKEKDESVFEYEIAFNCIPKIGSFSNNGYTTEEIKMMTEPLKILKDFKYSNLKINATCVRVPVFVGHGQSVSIEFEDTSDIIDLGEIYEILDSHMYNEVYDNFSEHIITQQDCVKREENFICRLRADNTVRSGINLWLVGDNLYKGGSLNAIQIAEHIVKYNY